MQYSITQYNRVQYSTTQHNTVQYSTIHYGTVSGRAMFNTQKTNRPLCFSTTEYWHSTQQYSRVKFSTVLYRMIQYSTVRYSTILLLLFLLNGSVFQRQSPISLVPVLAKVLESFVADWLHDILTPVLDPNQFGNIKGQSTAHPPLMVPNSRSERLCPCLARRL